MQDELARARAEAEQARENLRSAWTALRMIREAVETLGPPGAMRSEEAVLATLGPEPTDEAEAIIEGIKAIAAEPTNRIPRKANFVRSKIGARGTRFRDTAAASPRSSRIRPGRS